MIRTGVWTYPPDGILGITLLAIPAEELFFFVIQTYITSLLYVLINKPTLYMTHLIDDTDTTQQGTRRLILRKRIGQGFFLSFTLSSYYFYSLPWRRGTYLALICGWAGPVLLALWCFSYQLLLTLPRSKTWLPIFLPTAYLCVVDTIALLRGTWSIEQGTKLNFQLWPGLEVEEALFFLVTNTLIVFGLTAFENAVAVVQALPDRFPHVPEFPDPRLLLNALFLSPENYDVPRLDGVQKACDNLSAKSRSFSLASSVFSGRLRIDLILLYAFCRVGDDLVDHAENIQEAEQWISHLKHFLDIVFSDNSTSEQFSRSLAPFPPALRAILSLLPAKSLPAEPLYSLLEGFGSDLAFATANDDSQFPIRSDKDLEIYASRVASTVALLCLHLVYLHDPASCHAGDEARHISVKKRCLLAGERMGLALQYTNIARDVHVDAEDGRCYLPTEWLAEHELTPTYVQQSRGKAQAVRRVRERLLEEAFTIYQSNRDAIEDLPQYARPGIRVAVENYMEIGRILRERLAAGEPLDNAAGSGRKHRATVPKLRRLRVAWQSLTAAQTQSTWSKGD